MAGPTGILLVDKPGGMTSHDVVARARKALGTRKIGHAGTLDPMATGLLILGVDGATRLLTFIVGLDKTYEATIRLGAATDTDDAEARSFRRADAAAIAALRDAVAAGDRRAHRRDLAGAEPRLGDQGRRASRLRPRPRGRGGRARPRARSPCRVRRAWRARAATDEFLDLDVVVDCSSGTYIRALARDLGAALGVGGHLTALRRTRIGPFDVDGAAARRPRARTACSRPAAVATAVLGALPVSARRGARPAPRQAAGRCRRPPRRAVADAPRSTRAGALVGIVERRGDDVKSVMNLPEEDSR